MPIWISQDTVTADTPRNHSRTAWLLPLKDRIQAAIREYVAANPGGDTVTLAVFERIPPRDVQKLLPKGRNIDAGRRELGLRVPLELIDMYGAARVETLRRDNGRTASPRRTGRDWPRNFTPHRVTVAAAAARRARSTDFREGFPHTELWRTLFAGWLDAVTDCRAATDDLPWRHTGAANLSLLAGSVWRQPGAVVLSGLPAPRQRTGPGSLWFTHRGRSHTLTTAAIWPSEEEDAGEQLCRELDYIADCPPPRAADHHTTACFVIPALAGAGRTVDEAEAVLDAAWEATDEATAMARFLAWDDPLALAAVGGETWPGVMLVVR